MKRYVYLTMFRPSAKWQCEDFLVNHNQMFPLFLAEMIPDDQALKMFHDQSHTSQKQEKNWRRLLSSSEKLTEKVHKSRRQNAAEKVR